MHYQVMTTNTQGYIMDSESHTCELASALVLYWIYVMSWQSGEESVVWTAHKPLPVYRKC